MLCAPPTCCATAVRPADLVARLGGDEFALWLDGADESTAAERAEHLRLAGPRALAATAGERRAADPVDRHRHPLAGRGEDIETVLHRADQAMYEVKRSGRGHWRVAHPANE